MSKVTVASVVAIISPCLWWLYLFVHPELANSEIDLFLFYEQEKPQKSYWYVFYTTKHILSIVVWSVIHELNQNKKLKVITKSVVVLQFALFAEYWLFGGTIPYAPIAISFIYYLFSKYKM